MLCFGPQWEWNWFDSILVDLKAIKRIQGGEQGTLEAGFVLVSAGVRAIDDVIPGSMLTHKAEEGGRDLSWGEAWRKKSEATEQREEAEGRHLVHFQGVSGKV